MNVVALSDTHITRGGARRLPRAVYRLLERTDLILHAGDVVVAEVLTDLERFAPVRAVLGNNDHELSGILPEQIRFDAGGVRAGMIHSAGPAAGRARRLARGFEDCALVVFGHSHIPLIERDGDRTLINPGSPTDKRRQPHVTVATFGLHDGRIVRPRLRVVD